MSETAPRLIFCHGVPGSAQDAALFARGLGAARADSVALDLLAGWDAYERAFLAASAKAPVHLAGFSLGAMAALRLALAHPDRVLRVTLISPAAPLGFGTFLPDMDGAPVFAMAAKRGPGFRLMTAGQAAVARLAPRAMLRMLFARSCPADQAVLEDPTTVEALLSGLKNSFQTQRAGYRTYVQDYVRWTGEEIDGWTCPVTIWQGAADTWAPPAMAEALAQRLPQADLRLVDGLGHYSIAQALAAA